MKIVRNYLTTLIVLLTYNIHNAQNIEIDNLKYLEFKEVLKFVFLLEFNFVIYLLEFIYPLEFIPRS